MISVEGVTKRFGELVAVRDLDFEVNRGEVVGFLGPNGAGKTTTMRMLTGTLEPDEGRVLYDHVPISQDLTAAKKRYRQCLKMVVADTVSSAVELQEELRWLLGDESP